MKITSIDLSFAWMFWQNILMKLYWDCRKSVKTVVQKVNNYCVARCSNVGVTPVIHLDAIQRLWNAFQKGFLRSKTVTFAKLQMLEIQVGTSWKNRVFWPSKMEKWSGSNDPRYVFPCYPSVGVAPMLIAQRLPQTGFRQNYHISYSICDLWNPTTIFT